MSQTLSVPDEVLTEIAASNHEDQHLSVFKMRHWDVRYDNTCNLGCRTCIPTNSSTIAAEQGIEPSLIDRDKWQAEMMKEVPHVLRAHFAGGEPLLMPGHRQILREMIAQGKTDARISYNTNLTRLDHRGDDIIPLWQQLPNLSVMVSMDHIGDAAGYVRHGTNWQQFLSNWNRLRSECTHADISIVLTWSIFNALDICEILDYLRDAMGNPSVDINYVQGPPWLPWQLPVRAKESLRDRMQVWSFSQTDEDLGTLVRQMSVDLMQPGDEEVLKHFTESQARLDSRRRVRMADRLPRLHAALYGDANLDPPLI